MTNTERPQAIILKAKSGQWLYEIWQDDEQLSGGAGFDSDIDAIEAAQEDNPHLNLNIVLRPQNDA